MPFRQSWTYLEIFRLGTARNEEREIPNTDLVKLPRLLEFFLDKRLRFQLKIEARGLRPEV